jgi:uncharacterized protein
VILAGRSICSGTASGKVLKLNEPLSFLGGVNGSTGELNVEDGGNVSDRILVFPRGKGSTVGSFTMYDLMVHGKAPAAVINRSAETIVATGAVISSIPMVDQIDVDLILDGDEAVVDSAAGTVELPCVRLIESVSSAVVRDGKVLMLRRPDSVPSFPSRWSLVAGKIESGEPPADAAVREIMEETGMHVGGPKASLGPIHVREGDIIWKVWPFLFDAPSGDPVLNSENTDYIWVHPSDVQGMEHVPKTPDVLTSFGLR